MPGKFVIRKGTTGKFRFNLHSTNGQVVATSESYSSKASAMAGIRSVQNLAAGAEVEDTTTRQYAKAQDAAKVAKAAKKSTAKKSTAKKATAKKASATKASTRATPAKRATKAAKRSQR